MNKLQQYRTDKLSGITSFPKDDTMTKAEQCKLITEAFGVIPRYSGKTRTFYLKHAHL